MKNQFISIAIVGIAAAICRADAAITTFSDKAAFLSATAATNRSGTLPNLGLVPGGASASFSAGGVTFAISPPSSSLYCGYFSNDPLTDPSHVSALLPGPVIAISERENLNAQFDGPVFSAGFDFVEPSVGTSAGCFYFDSTFTMTLKRNGLAVGSLTFNVPDDVAAFAGVQSDVAFDRLEIRETIGGCDNEFFGQFYTGTRPLPALSIRVSQVELCWQTDTNFLYQLEYREALSTNSWLPLGGPVLGTGARYCTNDSILPGQPQRFYQLVLTNAP